jgi:hypothetical protein
MRRLLKWVRRLLKQFKRLSWADVVAGLSLAGLPVYILGDLSVDDAVTLAKTLYLPGGR